MKGKNKNVDSSLIHWASSPTRYISVLAGKWEEASHILSANLDLIKCQLEAINKKIWMHFDQ